PNPKPQIPKLFCFSLSLQIPNYSSLCPPTSKPQKARITAARLLLGYSAFLPLRGSASVGCVAVSLATLSGCHSAFLLPATPRFSRVAPSSVGFSLHRRHAASSASHFSGSTFFFVTAYDLCGSAAAFLFC
ncbi:hypothetical protein HN51_048092, partial [Arachis hypogaea]